MTRFKIEWGPDNDLDDTRPEATVTTAAELDAVLDQICSSEGAPYAVDMLPADGDQGMLQLGVGHRERGFITYFGEPGGIAQQPGIQTWPDTIVFNSGGTPTEVGPSRTRVTPDAVRQAAHEYLRTGKTPSGFTWLDEIEP